MTDNKDINFNKDNKLNKEIEEGHYFDYLLDLEGSDLVSEIEKIEDEKPSIIFRKESSKKLIQMQDRDYDERTVSYSSWDDMKHYTSIDYDNNEFVYPFHDESLEHEVYKKSPFIPPQGFEYLNCRIENKPLGIIIVTIETGRKTHNAKDMRYISETTKKSEEIFLYNFEDENWFRSKNKSPDYLRRLKIIQYIEKVYRTLLPDFYARFNLLKGIQLADIGESVEVVKERYTKISEAFGGIFKDGLFILMFYNVIDKPHYQFYLSEILSMKSVFDKIVIALDEENDSDEFLSKRDVKKISEVSPDSLTELEKINVVVIALSKRYKLFLNAARTAAVYDIYKRDISTPFPQRSDLKEHIQKGFYLSPSPKQKENNKLYFGEYKIIPTLGQVLNDLKKTDIALSKTQYEAIQEGISEFIRNYTISS